MLVRMVMTHKHIHRFLSTFVQRSAKSLDSSCAYAAVRQFVGTTSMVSAGIEGHNAVFRPIKDNEVPRPVLICQDNILQWIERL
jgi:hypothetical protein